VGLKMKNSEEKIVAKEKAKKPYQSPSLTEYGNIQELTAGGSGPNPEGRLGWAKWRQRT
jgi:hypothetical protein